eukprot:267265-Rhodomonas_salina.2
MSSEALTVKSPALTRDPPRQPPQVKFALPDCSLGRLMSCCLLAWRAVFPSRECSDSKMSCQAGVGSGLPTWVLTSGA